MMKMWVHLFCLLLLRLNVCSARRVLVENKELHIASQNLEAEVACAEAGETMPWIASANNATKEEANNLLKFRFRENRTGDEAEHKSPELKLQGLSISKPSPGVGHMQVSRVPKSGKRRAMNRMDEERVLESTPSPGVGN